MTRRGHPGERKKETRGGGEGEATTVTENPSRRRNQRGRDEGQIDGQPWHNGEQEGWQLCPAEKGTKAESEKKTQGKGTFIMVRTRTVARMTAGLVTEFSETLLRTGRCVGWIEDVVFRWDCQKDLFDTASGT